MNRKIDTLERVLRSLSVMTGTSILWKTHAPLHPNAALSEDYRAHQSCFCRKVKTLGEGIAERCISNDWLLISRKVFEIHGSFVHGCHANACDLVVPFFNHDRLIGNIICGPFRREGETPVYPETAGEYGTIPVFSPEQVESFAEIIRIAGEHVMLLLEELEEASADLVDKRSVSDERVLRIIGFMENNFRRRLSLGKLAQLANLSKSRLAHLFRNETGLGCAEFLQRIRVREACRMLQQTRLPISEISAHCGISDQSRLAVLVRRYSNLTPQEYRARYAPDIRRLRS